MTGCNGSSGAVLALAALICPEAVDGPSCQMCRYRAAEIIKAAGWPKGTAA